MGSRDGRIVKSYIICHVYLLLSSHRPFYGHMQNLVLYFSVRLLNTICSVKGRGIILRRLNIIDLFLFIFYNIYTEFNIQVKRRCVAVMSYTSVYHPSQITMSSLFQRDQKSNVISV